MARFLYDPTFQHNRLPRLKTHRPRLNSQISSYHGCKCAKKLHSRPRTVGDFLGSRVPCHPWQNVSRLPSQVSSPHGCVFRQQTKSLCSGGFSTRSRAVLQARRRRRQTGAGRFTGGGGRSKFAYSAVNAFPFQFTLAWERMQAGASHRGKYRYRKPGREREVTAWQWGFCNRERRIPQGCA